MTDISDLAQVLDHAAATHQGTEAFAESISVEDAYKIQDAYLSIRSNRSASRKIGYKVALTSPAAQSALQSPCPAYGQLLATDVETSGVRISLAKHFSPILEPELMFKVRQDLSPSASIVEITQKTEVAAGLECPESRFQHWFGGSFPALKLHHVISDNCLAGFIVISDNWVDSNLLDFPALKCDLSINSKVVKSGSGSEVLGNPLRAIEWLNLELSKKGTGLKSGDIISSGTFMGPLKAEIGLVEADFDGGLGKVSVIFEA